MSLLLFLRNCRGLKRAGGVNEELLDTIELIAVILGGLKGECEDGE